MRRLGLALLLALSACTIERTQTANAPNAPPDIPWTPVPPPVPVPPQPPPPPPPPQTDVEAALSKIVVGRPVAEAEAVLGAATRVPASAAAPAQARWTLVAQSGKWLLTATLDATGVVTAKGSSKVESN